MSTQALVKGAMGVKTLLDSPAYKNRFSEILNRRAPQFCASIVAVTRQSFQLEKCDANSIIGAALVAATLDLPINKDLGFAWIIPYGSEAQFQLGYKGYVQLAQRSGQYENINVTEVYEGELQNFNRLTGRFTLDGQRTGDKVVGYAAYFRLVNGFEKQEYWTKEEVEAHARRFSQGFKTGKGPWKDDFDPMAMKSVLKNLLSKWGILSVEMQSALRFDSAAVKQAKDGTLEPEFVDNDERFRNAKPVAATDDPELAREGLAPVSEPPVAAPNATTPPANAPAQNAPRPAATPQRPAPASDPDEDLVRLVQLCAEEGVTEPQLVTWAVKKFRLSQMTSFNEILETSPARITHMVNNWAALKAEIKATKAPENL